MDTIRSIAEPFDSPRSTHRDRQVWNDVACATAARTVLRRPPGSARVPARMIEVISPAGFEHFFWAVGEAAVDGPPDPATITVLVEKAGLEMQDAPWLNDVIARYDLTPPPGAR